MTDGAASRRTATVQGLPAGWLEDGPESDLPLLLLHGAGFDHADLSWGPVARSLMRTRYVIRPDLPGYGATAGFGRAYTLDDLGQWLVAFLDARGIDRVDVAGLSMGGGLALWLALNHPQRVRGVIPVCPYGLMRRAPLHLLGMLWARRPLSSLIYRAGAARRGARAGLRLAGCRNRAQISDDLVEQITRVSREQRERRSFDAFLAGEMRASGLRSCFTDRLSDLRAPVLLIQGRYDPVVPARHARRAVRRLPNARLEMLDARHLLTRDCPEELAALISAFLSELDQSDAAPDTRAD